jgi:outer membrane protein assembly factor BamB
MARAVPCVPDHACTPSGARLLSLGGRAPGTRPIRFAFTLNPGPAVAQGFGVALAAIGDVIVASGLDGGAHGVVALFDARTGALGRLVPNPRGPAEDGFGTSVAIDDAAIAVSAVGDAAVHVFTHDGRRQTTARPVSRGKRFGFGRSLALGSGRVATGSADAVHVFDVESGVLLRRFDSPVCGLDRFGSAVALAGDVLLVGAPASYSAFAGRVYAFSARTGHLLWTRTAPAPRAGDGFGHALAVDGQQVLVGAPHGEFGGHDGAYLLALATGRVRRVYRCPPRSRMFGSAVALRGNRVLIGSPGDGASGEATGAAYLYATRTAKRLATFRPTRNPLARTGDAVAFARSRMVVGAPGGSLVGVFS